jgi:hypothetical protein
MQNGQLYLQVHWEPVTVGADGGSLPTPTTMDHLPQRSPEALKKQMEGPRKGRTKLANLREAVNPNTQRLFNSMLPTPTAMDTKDNALKHATKLLQGKTHRASGQPIQVSLSDKVMMEEIKQNPELMKIYQDHQMEERLYLPPQEKFVTYLKEQTTIKELAAKTTIKKTTIEHWFRKDKAGFSFPSIENWEEIKPHLKIIQFDKEMTTVKTKEWINKSQMLPTPTATDYKGRSGQGHIERYGEHRISDVLTQTGDNMNLNPCFVEEMMGYPIGHTDLRH